MDIYGIIGASLKHSFSPEYFNNRFKRENIDATYLSLELKTIHELKDIILQYPNLKGLNVTIPYKESVVPLLDSIDATAQKIGAVNCIKIQEGKLIGYNTDWLGFKETLLHLPLNIEKKALILGTGGASKAVAAALASMNIAFQLISRTEQHTSSNKILNYQELAKHELQCYQLIINTTPVGMFPNINQAPDIPYELINDTHILYDVIYNPEETLFLKRGLEKKSLIINGYQMLLNQADLNWNIWKNNNL